MFYKTKKEAKRTLNMKTKEKNITNRSQFNKLNIVSKGTNVFVIPQEDDSSETEVAVLSRHGFVKI